MAGPRKRATRRSDRGRTGRLPEGLPSSSSSSSVAGTLPAVVYQTSAEGVALAKAGAVSASALRRVQVCALSKDTAIPFVQFCCVPNWPVPWKIPSPPPPVGSHLRSAKFPLVPFTVRMGARKKLVASRVEVLAEHQVEAIPAAHTVPLSDSLLLATTIAMGKGFAYAPSPGVSRAQCDPLSRVTSSPLPTMGLMVLPLRPPPAKSASEESGLKATPIIRSSFESMVWNAAEPSASFASASLNHKEEGVRALEVGSRILARPPVTMVCTKNNMI